MGWYFSRQTRDQLISELIQPQENEHARSMVLAHALRGNVLWSVVHVTAKQAGAFDLKEAESTTFIRCDLLEGSDGKWGYNLSMNPCIRTTTRAHSPISTWRPCDPRRGEKGYGPITDVGRQRRGQSERTRTDVMDPMLTSLPDSLLRLIEDHLSNNEDSSDEELLTHFVSSGLTEIEARQALSYRSQYLTHIYLDGFTPIRKGREALRYNPKSRQFEPA